MNHVYDSADYDAISELIEQPGPGVVLLLSRVQSELDRRRMELESATPEAVPCIQGQIQALRTVLSIPQILRAEIGAAVGKPR